ncbi:MAG: mechanosensitive ion channel family protein [Gaiellaceae bacterium]
MVVELGHVSTLASASWEWHRLLTVGVVIAIAGVVALAADHAITRREFEPQTLTRLRIVRHTVRTGIVLVGLLSALLVIPQVRAVAGGILASSAIVGLVIGFAARTTLANAVAGIMIAFTQPLRLGDRVETEGARGVVEEIGLIYTFIRLDDGSRLVIPNEKLASDSIRNSTIRSDDAVAEINVRVPIAKDLGRLVRELEQLVAGEQGQVFVSDLADTATICIKAHAASPAAAERLEHELRLRVHGALQAEGAFV